MSSGQTGTTDCFYYPHPRWSPWRRRPAGCDHL